MSRVIGKANALMNKGYPNERSIKERPRFGMTETRALGVMLCGTQSAQRDFLHHEGGAAAASTGGVGVLDKKAGASQACLVING